MVIREFGPEEVIEFLDGGKATIRLPLDLKAAGLGLEVHFEGAKLTYKNVSKVLERMRELGTIVLLSFADDCSIVHDDVSAIRDGFPVKMELIVMVSDQRDMLLFARIMGDDEELQKLMPRKMFFMKSPDVKFRPKARSDEAEEIFWTYLEAKLTPKT